jgi:lipopolysaccharide transport system ATP-binding protein
VREDFWALRNVSFDVHEGEVVGIIGRNGAGKSTLLKILSRITEPSEGRVTLRGRVASLLEVGTGFHPELTGRENIYLNGAVLGMSRVEIKKKFDEIVAFAEVEKFLDTPVKHYSSGMYVRLAFAVAAHLDPEIHIVDEVLAVGDAEFQKKCLGKMGEVATGGRTVLFVSHNLGAISQLCNRGLVLAEGQLRLSAPAREAVRFYSHNACSLAATDVARLFRGPLSGKIAFTSISVESSGETSSSHLSPSSAIRIDAVGVCHENIPAFRTTMAIYADGIRLFSIHDVPDSKPLKANTTFRASFEIPAHFLRPADYSIALGGHSATNGEWLWATDVAQFSILAEWSDCFRPYDHGLINITDRGTRIQVPNEQRSAFAANDHSAWPQAIPGNGELISGAKAAGSRHSQN